MEDQSKILKRAIEEDFPIVEINRLAVPERNAFKPIYQMHKWFARRASCVFRAILLGALKPAGTNIMEEFYKNHSNDPDTKGKIVLDPFMGGGTTVVEALRLGCRVIGIDLNPVAWFIVKTEVEPVDLAELDAAFDRLARRTVSWSGKPLRDTLLDLYKTEPPWTAEEVCGLPASDIIYTFWVKSAICTAMTCKKQVPLFSDYVVAAKSPSIYYYPDCSCPKCKKTFDWELEPASLIADPRLMVHSTTYSGGEGRSTTRWTYAHPDGGLYVAPGEGTNGQAPVQWGQLAAKGTVCCPHCREQVKPVLPKGKKKRKKVPLTVLLCPRTEEVFQWRGDLAAGTKVKSPGGHEFDPFVGNLVGKGEYLCPHFGCRDSVINSIRSLPEDQLLPTSAYGMQVYAAACDPANDPAKRSVEHPDLFDADAGAARLPAPEDDEDEDAIAPDQTYTGPFVPPTQNLIWKQKGKFYTRHSPRDAARLQQVEREWEKNKGHLLYPKSEVPRGQETGRLIEHHYRYWYQMFNPRQLLALSTLLEGIADEAEPRCREQLMLCLSGTTDTNNQFSRYMASRDSAGGQTVQGVFARHDYQPKMTICEQNVWGLAAGGMGSFIRRYWQSRSGIEYAHNTSDVLYTDENGKRMRSVRRADPIYNVTGAGAVVHSQSSKDLSNIGAKSLDFVITDPPYSDNVNYAELSNFYYVWLRLLLKENYAHFLPEHVPTSEEVIKNKHRGKGDKEFGEDLSKVFSEANRSLKSDGLMAFTFHHAEDSAWQALLEGIFDAGFQVEAIYPVHSEGESSLHLMDKEAIAYDLIHVCRKRSPEDVAKPRSWAGLRLEVRKRARAEIERIESGRYGNQPLPPPDVRMVLIGKCLEVYSRHYGAVLDWDGKPYPLRSALQDIRMMVEQVVSKESALPPQLENADALSQVWLLALCDKREVSVDSISKITRGVFEVSDLTGHKPPILRKARVKGGRTYEVLTPQERCDTLRKEIAEVDTAPELALGLSAAAKASGPPLVDVLHLLLAEAERGERLDHWVERFRGQNEAIQAGLEYLKQRDPNRWAKASDKLLPFYSDMFSRGVMTGEG